MSLRRQPGKTVHDLIRASGYLANPDYLTLEAVLQYVRAHPKLVKAWRVYSEDKRTKRGWYFTTSRSDVEVGYVDAAKGVSDVHRYGSREEACAHFILREAHEIAQESAGWLTKFFEALFGLVAWITKPFRK